MCNAFDVQHNVTKHVSMDILPEPSTVKMAFNGIPIMQTSYESGNCDFCKQRNVKVKPLNCKRHFYCRTCNDFSPKFQRKDFQCRACSERLQQITEDNLKKVDNFLGRETGGCKIKKDANVSLDDGSFITFDKDNLEGEHLLSVSMNSLFDNLIYIFLPFLHQLKCRNSGAIYMKQLHSKCTSPICRFKVIRCYILVCFYANSK